MYSTNYNIDHTFVLREARFKFPLIVFHMLHLVRVDHSLISFGSTHKKLEILARKVQDLSRIKLNIQTRFN